MGLFDKGGSKAAKKAAEAQTKTAREGIQFQKDALNTVLGLQAPQQEVGFDALNLLSDVVGIDRPSFRPDFGAPIASGDARARGTEVAAIPLDERRATLQDLFESSPIYQNVYRSAIGEGTKSLERMANARRSLYSGSTIRGIEDYAGRLGANTWNQFQNTLSGLAGVGQQATGQAQSAIQSTAPAVQRGLSDIGNAQAQGIYNAAQARQSGWNNVFRLAGQAPQILAGFS